uniref:Uncharacterized protein n=1 Tax=Siphoviridae sp. ctmpG14 TaxID=2825654 RepID=A0A8S5PAN5_9CAUD|nr:MAG TPA: hypothetical protein [Siphoviridae sp. ctmpG14]
MNYYLHFIFYATLYKCQETRIGTNPYKGKSLD